MAGLRVHVVMDPELVRRIDVVAGYRGVSRGEWLRRVALGALEKEATPLPPLEASEQALGNRPDDSEQRDLGVRLPAPAPAEQPPKDWDDDEAHEKASREYFSRVRSSSAARPFRPAPKGKS